MRSTVNVRWLWNAGLVLLFALWAICPVLAEQPFVPTFRPALDITLTTGAINIDGRLDDPGWKSVSPVRGFVERHPGDNTEPEVATQVYVTYDEKRLYVGFVCYDDPEAVRATMCQRDQFSASNDDNVVVLLDTYGSAAWAYELFVNPYGIQKDALWTNSPGMEEDFGFDLIWESAARKTDSGYTVEIAIPFSSLRFPDRDVQSWRMDFWRNRPREMRKQFSWAAYDRNEQCWPCQWGTVSGMKDVHPRRGLEILPATVAHQSGNITDPSNPNSPFENHDARGELSLGAKYSLSSDATLEATYNPDFSQVESDAAQIDVNTTIALFYPEHRPFFQEGSDIFATPFNSFFARTINAPQFASKLTARQGRNRIGILVANDESSPYIIPLDASSALLNVGKSTSTVVRGSRQIGDASQLGFIVTDRRFSAGGSGTVASVDGRFRFGPTYSLSGQYIFTHTAEPDAGPTYGGMTFDRGKHTVALDGESYSGDVMLARLDRRSSHVNIFITYNQISPSYRTENGFDPVNNHRTIDTYANIVIRPKSTLLTQITPEFYYSRRWDFITGVERYDVTMGNVVFSTGVAQTDLSFGYYRSYERWQNVPFADLWNIVARIDTRPSSLFGAGAGYARGVGLARYAMAKGTSDSCGVYLFLKPVDRLTIEPNLEFQRMTDPASGQRYFSGYITRTRIQLQAARTLSLRLIIQYDDFNRLWEIDPLLTYRLNPFTLFYVGTAVDYGKLAETPGDWSTPSKWRTTSRQVFVKLQYLIQT
jgi:hypothetical protein